MKNTHIFILAFLLTLPVWPSNAGGLVLDTVGPEPGSSAAVTPTDGVLVVYSAYDSNADFNSRDPYRPECSDYEIFNADGKLAEQVHNVADSILQNPVPVTLPEGKYRVIARANGYGVVTVPVVIAAKQKTILHLEGGSLEKPASDQTNFVRLPGGEVVGWRAARL